jgi:hypothetical protein
MLNDMRVYWARTLHIPHFGAWVPGLWLDDDQRSRAFFVIADAWHVRGRKCKIQEENTLPCEKQTEWWEVVRGTILAKTWREIEKMYFLHLLVEKWNIKFHNMFLDAKYQDGFNARSICLWENLSECCLS